MDGSKIKTVPALWLLLAAGCYTGTDPGDGPVAEDGAGDASDAGDAGDGDGDGDGDPGSDDGGGEEEEIAGLVPMRRLNAREYRNTVSDLFGYAELPDYSIPGDPKARSFDNDAESLTPTAAHVEAYEQAAQRIARRVADDYYADLTGCPDVEDAVCARAFVAEFGRRVFRRPLEAEEVERFSVFFDEPPGDADPRAAVELTVQLLLMSPQFLYRIEQRDLDGGDAGDGGYARIDAFELASRISYFVWGSMPDDILLDAAESGALESAEEIGAQVDRMLADPRAQAHFVDFARQWMHTARVREESRPKLELGGDNELHFHEVSEMMIEEFDRFVGEIVFAESPTLDTLLTSSESVINNELASIYGVSGPSNTDDEGWGRAELPADQRAGVLTSAVFLAGHAHPRAPSPVLRGVYVLNELLCTDLGPPPPVPTAMNVPAPNPNATNREAYEQLTAPDACQGCHTIINPLGFPFEYYDGWGRFRTVEPGSELEIDASGGYHELQFANAIDLTTQLSVHPEVFECAAVQSLRWAFGGDRAIQGDPELVPAIAAEFTAADGDLLALIRAIATAERFRSYPTRANR